MTLTKQRALDAMNTARDWADAKVASVVALGFASASAMAQSTGSDYGAVSKIGETQVVVLGVIAGFITMGIAVWGASYILRRFFPKGK